MFLDQFVDRIYDINIIYDYFKKYYFTWMYIVFTWEKLSEDILNKLSFSKPIKKNNHKKSEKTYCEHYYYVENKSNLA